MDIHLIPGAIATDAERAAVDAAITWIGRPVPSADCRGVRLPPSREASADRRSLGVGGQPDPGRPTPLPRHLLLPALHAAQSRVGWITEGALNYICDRLSVPPAEAYGVASFYAMFALDPQPPTIVHVCDDIACLANGAESLCRDLERLMGPADTPSTDGAATWRRSPCLGLCERAPAVLYQRAGVGCADSTLTEATADAVMAHLQETPGSDLETPGGDAGRYREGSAGLRAGGTEGSAGLRAGGTEGSAGLRAGGTDGSAGLRAGVQRSVPQCGAGLRAGVQSAPGLRLLARVGRVDPESLDAYRSNSGYTALRRAMGLGPERTLREIVDSKLVGRGGAAFPTGRKWEAVARAPVRPHYLVCNADESEPGTFKDRLLMEEDPFALIEAMTIAGFVTGCEAGYLYIRGEYPLATARLTSAIAQTRRRGLLGDNVLGEGLRFDIELRRGAGAYICGEETALFNSIEGLRGEPRNKPPYPVEAGLFGRPTVVNNVETLVNVIDIVNDGGPAFAATGTPGSTGTKLFCVSGSARRPGLYEVPFGVTLRALIDLAGGVRDDRSLQAVLLGGAAGVFVTPGEIDMPLTFEGTRAAGATLGSGVVMLFDDRVDLRAILLRVAAFFRDESCGQCVPCRIGTVRQEEALHRLAAGRPLHSRDAEIALIDDVAAVMRDASICGLGHTASTAIQSGMRKLGVFGGPGGLL